MSKEIWVPIVNFEGFYSVSNLGMVRSEARIIDENRHKGWKPKKYTVKEKMLKASPQDGYPRVSLSKQSKVTYMMVHRLVAKAFLGDCPENCEVRHLDGNRGNPRIENLAYGTRSENISDAIRHGTFPIGAKRPGAILNDKSALEIYNLADSDKTKDEIAKPYGILPSTVAQIWRGETWRHVTKGIKKHHRMKNIFKIDSSIDMDFFMNGKRKEVMARYNITLSQLKRKRNQLK